MKSISSRHNPIVKRVRDAIREHAGEIVLEGRKMVLDAVARGWKPLVILTTHPEDDLPQQAILQVTKDVFQSVAETRSPQGVMGVFERPRFDAGVILGRSDTVAVALDGVQDPGNVGTIVRLAAAFDAAGVLLLPGCADAYSPKAVRSSVGAILQVPVAAITERDLIGSSIPLVAAAAGGTRADAPAAGAVLIFGSEGSGVSGELLRHSKTIAIAMSANVESLNVASSAAILLAASYRSRISAGQT